MVVLSNMKIHKNLSDRMINLSNLTLRYVIMYLDHPHDMQLPIVTTIGPLVSSVMAWDCGIILSALQRFYQVKDRFSFTGILRWGSLFP